MSWCRSPTAEHMTGRGDVCGSEFLARVTCLGWPGGGKCPWAHVWTGGK